MWKSAETRECGESEKHDATQEIHRITDNLRADTGPGITADVNRWK